MEKSRNQGNIEHKTWNDKKKPTQKTKKVSTTDPTKYHKKHGLSQVKGEDTDCNSYTTLKSTCDVNLLSKLSIIFKEWRVMNNVDRGRVIVLFVL